MIEVRHAEVHQGSSRRAEDGSIPFISFANKFLVAGASFNPADARGLDARRNRRGARQPDEPDHRGDHRLGELPDRGDLHLDQRPAEQRLLELGRRRPPRR